VDSLPINLPTITRSNVTRESLLRELGDKPQQVVFDVDRAAIDQDSRTVDLAWASELPYERWWGREILDCQKQAVRMGRITNRAALLLNHDPEKQIGVVERATLDNDKKGRARVRFSRSPLGEEIFADVVDGIRQKVSVGYRIHDLVLEKKEDELSTYRVTDWEPHEISIVSVAADDTVGVGRGLSGQPQGAKAMTQDVKEPSRADSSPDSATALATRVATDNASARADERKKHADLIRELNGIGAMWPEYDGAALAMKAAEDPNMTADAFRQVMLDVVAKNKAAPKTVTGRVEKSGDRHVYGSGPREMLQRTQVYNNVGRLFGMDDQEVAYRAGMWCRAVLGADAGAAQWCRDHGVVLRQGGFNGAQFDGAEVDVRAVGSSTFSSGGWLIPAEMSAAMIVNREQYGVARRICRMWPMSTATLQIPRWRSGTQAYFSGEGTLGTDSDPAGDQLTLSLKDCMATTRIGKSTAMDAAISLADFVTSEQSRARAVKEDSILIIGDGTSTYGGMDGVKTLLDAAANSIGRVQAVAGHDTFPEVDASDIATLMGALPVYARAGARFVCSGVFEANVFGRIKLVAGGNSIQTLQGAVLEQDYGGFPITVAHDMPSGAGTTYNGLSILLFGNFGLGVAFGHSTEMIMTVDPYTRARYNQTEITSVERIDIVAHGVERSTTGSAGPLVALHGRT
jgi:HK97 family phage major capsid protein/HK97 family phage prohead protease